MTAIVAFILGEIWTESVIVAPAPTSGPDRAASGQLQWLGRRSHRSARHGADVRLRRPT